MTVKEAKEELDKICRKLDSLADRGEDWVNMAAHLGRTTADLREIAMIFYNAIPKEEACEICHDTGWKRLPGGYKVVCDCKGADDAK